MRQSLAVSTLFKESILLPPENVSNSLLGYLFFREKLLELVLGDSETNILYWVGKELGNSLVVQVIEEIEDIFLQLDLGQVHMETNSASLINYRVTHNRYNLLKKERLEKTLHLEAGLMAGIAENVLKRYCAATVQMDNKNGMSALIQIAVD